MYSLLFLGIVSALLTLVLTPLVRALAIRFNLLDRPDGSRKTHSRPIPRLGGVAIAAGFTITYMLWFLSPLSAASTILAPGLPLVVSLLPAATLIFAIGLLDDLFPMRAPLKLAAQTCAAVLVFFSGVHAHSIAGIPLHPLLSFTITVGWILLCTNAFNLIDGLDGLATGLGLFACLTTLIASLAQGNVPLALATVGLAGALLGFLRYNLPPATIFLGDSGSMLIGFLLGCYGLIWSQKSATLLGLTLPAMAISVPLFDVALAVARRFLTRRPIFGADRGHIHHMLQLKGWTARRTVLVLYTFAALAAAAGLIAGLAAQRTYGLVVIAFAAVAFASVHRLGYVEFRALGRVLRSSSIRDRVNAELHLDRLAAALRQAASPQESFDALATHLPPLGFELTAASLNGHRYRSPSPAAGLAWRVSIPLGPSMYVRMTRQEPSGTHLLIEDIHAVLVSTLAPQSRPEPLKAAAAAAGAHSTASPLPLPDSGL